MPDHRTTPAPAVIRGRTFPWGRVLAFLSVLLIAAGVWQVLRNSHVSAPLPAAVPASPFRLPAVSGDQVSLDDLRGQVVLLNFWATWCPPCKAEMPDLEALHREYGAEHGFTVVAVNMQEDRAVVEAFAQEHRLSFPLLLDARGLVSTQDYGIRSLPATILIDREGYIRDLWTGQLSRRAMLARLERVW